MDSIRYIQARLRRGAQTFAYLGVVVALLVFSGWLLIGVTGVIMMLALSVTLVLVPSQLPIPVLMRVRGARPLHPGEVPLLHEMVADLAGRARLSNVPTLYLQNGSELTAYATVSGDRSAIGVTPALLVGLDMDEIEGVLAHEMSHIESGDARVMGIAQAMRRLTHSLATIGWLLFPLSLLFGEALPVSPLALAALMFAPTVSYLAELGLSRTREYDADLAAARLTRNPEALARALWKLEQHQRGLLAVLFGLNGGFRIPEALRTHPPTRERVERLLELAPRYRRVSGPRYGGGGGLPPTKSTRWSVMMM